MRFVAGMMGLACALLTQQGVAQTLGTKPKSVQLSKVILDDETRPYTTKMKVGTICLFSQPLTFPKRKVPAEFTRVDTLFTTEMKAQGFEVVSPTQDLFASADSAEKGAFLIAAVVYPVDYEICSSINGFKGTIKIAATWSIFDRANQKIVATVETSGQAMQEKFARDGFRETWDRAFVANLDALLKQGSLQQYTGNPVTPVPVVQTLTTAVPSAVATSAPVAK